MYVLGWSSLRSGLHRGVLRIYLSALVWGRALHVLQRRGRRGSMSRGITQDSFTLQDRSRLRAREAENNPHILGIRFSGSGLYEPKKGRRV